MAQAVTLENYGYITEIVPPSLFKKLKEEADLAENDRYRKNGESKEFKSGLTGLGIPKHYEIVKNSEELKKFVLDLFFLEYNKVFPVMQEFKMLTHSTPVISTTAWVNIQEKNEFIPNHSHDGIASYVIWVKIPYDPIEEGRESNHISTFAFSYNTIIGSLRNRMLKVDKECEGVIMMFPARLQHCVYPFYTTDDRRISISGNIAFDTSMYAS